MMLQILMVMVLVAPLCQCSVICDEYELRDEYTADKTFWRSTADLQQVPVDIPVDALDVRIHCNQITHVPADVFSNLRACTLLTLAYNLIDVVELGAFNGLDSLNYLYLHGNRLQSLPLGVLSNLGALKTLGLFGNQFTTLSPSLFTGLNRPFNLRLNWAQDNLTNPLICDTRLCWLKREAEVGTMDFTTYGQLALPPCVGEVQWTQFICPASIPCHDPGQVEFSQRSTDFLPLTDNSASGLPFSTNYRLMYTCDTCYTGGGSIMCQSEGQWTTKPMCVSRQDVFCPAPTLDNGFMVPLSNEYGCGVKVTFTCDKGFTLEGASQRTCGENGEFIGDIPTCTEDIPCSDPGAVEFAELKVPELNHSGPGVSYPPGVTLNYLCGEGYTGGGHITCLATGLWTQKPQCVKSESSTALIVGVVTAIVGGMIIMGVIVLIIYFIKRRKSQQQQQQHQQQQQQQQQQQYQQYQQQTKEQQQSSAEVEGYTALKGQGDVTPYYNNIAYDEVYDEIGTYLEPLP